MQWVLETAGWASQTEFHVFWLTMLSRLGSTDGPGYLDEGEFTEYLMRHVFDMQPDLISGNFQHGLGKVPYGKTTYAPSALESKFRCSKNMMAKGYKCQDATSLVLRVR